MQVITTGYLATETFRT